MIPTPQQILRDVFGYAAFRGEQQAIVEHVTAGGDALMLMPTGGGKSLCYQIPALLRPGAGIVVSPLVALMQDQLCWVTPSTTPRACPTSRAAAPSGPPRTCSAS